MEECPITSDTQQKSIQVKHDGYETIIDSLKIERIKAIELAERERNEKLKTIQNVRDTDITSVEKQLQHDLQSLQRNLQEEIKQIQNEKEFALQQAFTENTDGVRTSMFDLDNEIRHCQSERDCEIRTAQLEYEQKLLNLYSNSARSEADKDVEKHALKQEFDTCVKVINEKCYKRVKELNQMSGIRNLRHQRVEEEVDIDKRFREEICRLEMEHEKSVSARHDHYKVEIKSIQKKSEIQIQVINDDIDERINYWNELYEKQLEEEHLKIDQMLDKKQLEEGHLKIDQMLDDNMS